MHDHSSDRLTVASTSLHRLFNGESIPTSAQSPISGQLYLPEYQRPYRWDARLVAGLYEDILDHFAEGKEQLHDYYLGSIILHQDDGHAAGPRLNIIDGQQRLTSMALLCALAGISPVPALGFRAPESRKNISANAAALREQVKRGFDLTRINVTLVVTRSEDDAYRFFETQNSGGVRLRGADIIKAHHLRAVDAPCQDDYARRWEGMQAMQDVLGSVMRSRHWQSLQWRDLASEKYAPLLLREQVVHELAHATGATGMDERFNQVRLGRSGEGWAMRATDGQYAIRQPLNAGVNTIHYLTQFHELHRTWCAKDLPADANGFQRFYHALVAQSDASIFLTRLYDCALCMYISQFGPQQVLEASLRLFRVVFSPRLSNEKAVRESTAQRFASDHPVLDWIAASYTHEQLMIYLKNFTYTVAPQNLDTPNGIKRRFVDGVSQALDIKIPPLGEGEDFSTAVAASFDASLQAAIERTLDAGGQPDFGGRP